MKDLKNKEFNYINADNESLQGRCLDLEMIIDNLEGKYNEILLSVEKKHPNETRHETALRYIKERENSISTETNNDDEV